MLCIQRLPECVTVQQAEIFVAHCYTQTSSSCNMTEVNTVRFFVLCTVQGIISNS